MKKITIKTRVVGTDIIIEVNNGSGAKTILQEDISDLFSESVKTDTERTVEEVEYQSLPHTVTADSGAVESEKKEDKGND